MGNSRKFLLDTHIYIWWMMQDRRLTREVVTILANSENEILLSTATVWEMVIKKRIGKLKVPRSWKKDLRESNFSVLSISLNHVLALENLPLIHRDPFDRLLIAQATHEKATLISLDPIFSKYKVKIFGSPTRVQPS